MLGRVLDPDTPPVVRHHLATVTVARLTTNAAYRYAPPFLATIARGLDVSVAEMGVALAVTDLCGLSSPLIGRLVDRLPRRASMGLGLAIIGAGTALAAASAGVVMFTVALMAVSLAKIVFDVGLGAWIADHVPFVRRSRIVGITETSWALGLLVGVSTLGVVTALSSWRIAYVVASAAVVTMAVVVARRMPREPAAGHGTGGAGPVARLTASGWCAVVGMFGLMSAAQTLFITFGPWLEDEYDFGGIGLAAVTFGLGAIELAASTTSAARTDRWGKERSVVAGAAVMVPAGLALGAMDARMIPGLLLLSTFICAFEFSIVSTIPIGGDLVPGAPARGLGTMLAFGTLGRAITVIPATRLYDRFGLTPAALMGAAFAALAGAAMVARLRLTHRSVVRGGPDRAATKRQNGVRQAR